MKMIWYLICLLNFNFRLMINGQETNQMVVPCLVKLVEDVRLNIGCIGLILDPQMDPIDQRRMVGIRSSLRNYPISIRMISMQEIGILDQCRSEKVLIVTPSIQKYQTLKEQVTKFLNSYEQWSIRNWLILLEEKQNNLEKEFPMDNIPYDSSLSVILGSQLIRLYRIKVGKSIIKQIIGEFKNNEFILNKWSKRMDLGGVKIKIASKNSTLSVLKGSGEHLELVGGIYSNIWKLLEEGLNFTTEVIETNQHGWFTNPVNGTWIGVESLLLSGQVDAIVMGLVESQAKRRDMYLTPPLYLRRYFIYIQEPSTQKNFRVKWDLYSAPFSEYLWLTIIVTIVVISIIIKIISQSLKNIHHENKELQLYTPDFCFLSVFRAFCNQSQEIDPQSISLRIMIIFSYTTAMLLVSSYSGVLVSFLATGRETLPFDSFEEILEDGTYEVGAVQNSSADLFFRNSRGVVHQIYEELMIREPKNFPNTPEEGMKRVCEKKFALVLPIENIINIEEYPCKILRLKRNYINIHLTIAFNWDFRFLSLFSQYFSELVDHGIIDRLNREAIRIFNMNNLVIESPSVDLSHIIPLLIELITAYLASILILLLEKIIQMGIKKKKFVVKNPLRNRYKNVKMNEKYHGIGSFF